MDSSRERRPRDREQAENAAATGHLEAVREKFAAIAPSYQAGQARSLRVELLVRLLRPGGREALLDVATGTGAVPLQLAPLVAEVVGVDATPEMLTLARRELDRGGRHNVRLLLANGEQLPCPDARFDLVTCVRALHHMSNPESCLREIARVMRPGGRLAILDNLTYEDPALASRHNALETRRDSSHSRTFSASGLKGALEQAGLAVRAWVAEEWLRRITAWWDDAGTESEERDRLLESIEAGTRAQDPFFLRHFQRLAGGWHFRYQQAWVLACRT